MKLGEYRRNLDTNNHIIEEDKEILLIIILSFRRAILLITLLQANLTSSLEHQPCKYQTTPGRSANNPFFIYGGVGLGKTHLMNAIGNNILKHNKEAKILYLHSEKFVADMVKALQHNKMDDFKEYYRSADALLVDDIQFAGKERSQEEFFHTFNALLEENCQIVLTCDRYQRC